MKILVLEGPDGGGKSTLAAEFGKIGYQVKPFGVPPVEAQANASLLYDFFNIPMQHAITDEMPTCFDRLYLSERIYGPLMRGGSPMTRDMEETFDAMLNDNHGQVIICLPPTQNALANYTKKLRAGQEYVQKAEIWKEVYVEYYHLLRKNQPNYIWFDYTIHDAASFAIAMHALQRAK